MQYRNIKASRSLFLRYYSFAATIVSPVTIMKELPLSTQTSTECRTAVSKGLSALESGDLLRAQRAFGKAVAKAAIIPPELAGDWPVYSRYLLANTLAMLRRYEEALHLAAEAFAMAKAVDDQHGWKPHLYELVANLLKRARAEEEHDAAASIETKPVPPPVIRSR